jgi:hypothetical protein
MTGIYDFLVQLVSFADISRYSLMLLVSDMLQVLTDGPARHPSWLVMSPSAVDRVITVLKYWQTVNEAKTTAESLKHVNMSPREDFDSNFSDNVVPEFSQLQATSKQRGVEVIYIAPHRYSALNELSFA